MGLYKSVEKRINWAANVEFDSSTGFYRYNRFGKYIYIRHPRHFLKEKDLLWLCEKIFFYHYRPTSDDVVVDLGAGYGEEAVYLSSYSPQVRYIGVEPQPVIYECLANTFRSLGSGFTASPYVVTNRDTVKFTSWFSYASVGEIPEGYIEVPTMKWERFLQYYDVDRIDLFKMNIEGAEKEIIQQITDFSFIKRFVISCHDFRANNNEGEWYRTKDAVLATLKENGYAIKSFQYGISWADDWIFAEK